MTHSFPSSKDLLLAKLKTIGEISDGMHVLNSTTIPMRVKVGNISAATWLTSVSTFTFQGRRRIMP